MKQLWLALLLGASLSGIAQTTVNTDSAAAAFDKALAAAQRGDYESCLAWFTKSANWGDAESMYRIGLLYEYNDLLKSGKDQAQAVAWLKKAVKAGWAQAGKELERYQKEQNLISMADWKTIHEGTVNAARDHWVKVIEWAMLGDGRYYTIGVTQYDKRGRSLMPFAAAITFQFIDEAGKVVKQERTGGRDYSLSFYPPKDGRYTIQAYYDMADCVGCHSADKPGAFKMHFSMAMFNYTAP